jgi:FMN phosphatase YigB (HAD superfamily)
MISFVYFDLGGVLMMDFSGTDKWAEMKRDMGINENNCLGFNKIWDQYRSRICVDYDVDNLIPLFEKECDIKLPSDYSMLSDFVNRFENNLSIRPVVTKISKTCRVGILTNMYPRMFDLIRKHNLLPPAIWNVIIDSSRVGCQKPDRKIYEIAQSKIQVSKDEILFVENGTENIQAAKEFGWQTFLYDSANPIESSRKLLELF